MTQDQLIEQLRIEAFHAMEVQISKKQMKTLLSTLAETVQAALVAGESVNLPGLATFSAVEKASRPGRNPRTGESVEIPAHRAPKIKPAATLKAALKEKS